MSLISNNLSDDRLVDIAINKFKNNLSLERVLNDSNQISFYKRQTPQVLLAAMAALVTNCNNMLNVQRGLNAMQIVSMAQSIIRDWWFLRLDEIAYAMSRGTSGFYGSAFAKLDYETINGWLMEYDKSERMLAVENLHKLQREKEAQEKEAEVLAIRDGYERYKAVAEKTNKNPLQIDEERRRKGKWGDSGYKEFEAHWIRSKAIEEQKRLELEGIRREKDEEID